MTLQVSREFVLAATLAGGALAGLFYAFGYFEKGVDIVMVSDHCHDGGAGTQSVPFPVKTRDWEDAGSVPIGEVIVVKGVILEIPALSGRVIAGPGSTIRIDGQSVEVNDTPLHHERPPRTRPPYLYALEHNGGSVYKVVYGHPDGLAERTFRTGPDELFVWGDTRQERCLDPLGVVPFSAVLGSL